jgi:calcium-dependent protein kinase
MYIVTQLLTKKEHAKLRATFMALDTNADGKLSREELLKGYEELYRDKQRAEQEVNTIMDNVDVDRSGSIDYSGRVRCRV